MFNLEILQLDNSHTPQWETWSATLGKWGLQDLAASLLEGSSPLTLVAAQFVYFSEPMLDTFVPKGHLKALAELLEEPTATQEFIEYLREGSV